MRPSYRPARQESDPTRSRANLIRCDLTGQLKAGVLIAPELTLAMELCVGCKACKRECPTGVDMARLKTEWLAHRVETLGLTARDRMIARHELQARRAHLHRYCHQMALGAFGAYEAVLRRIPGLDVETIDSGCCGMSGAFGYAADKIELSKAKLALFPVVRAVTSASLVIGREGQIIPRTAPALCGGA